MYDFIWAGTEASLEAYHRIESKFALNEEAFLKFKAYHANDPETDEVYGVDSGRKGLILLERIGNTSVIKVHGSLVASHKWYHGWLKGEVTSYEAIIDALAIAVQDEETKDILMDYASPGGMVEGLDVVTQAIMAASKIKPVNGHSDRTAFSAAYWMIVSCDEVSGSRMAEFGSIGTMAVLRTYADTEKNMGLKFHVLRDGEHKGFGNPYEELTKEKREVLQKGLTEANTFFLEHVSLRRGLLLADRDEWGQGDTYYAKDAMRRGMIDRVTTLSEILTRGSDSPNEPRSFAMKISQAKLAKIAAGAKPEDILTAEELVQYKASIEEVAPVVAEEPKGGEGGEGGGEGGDNEPAKPAVAAAAGDSAELHRLLKENGKLEAKVEGLQEKLDALQATHEASMKASNELLVVAQHAVKNLQVALGKPREAKASVTEVLAQFNELQGIMAKAFGGPGQHSADTPVDDKTSQQVETVGYRQVNQQSVKR